MKMNLANVTKAILIAMLSANRLAPWFFPWDPSGRTVAEEILSHGIPPSSLAIHGMDRGMHFGLNFYLKQEIPDWDSAHPKDEYLLLGGKNCNSLAAEFASCEEPPLYFEHSHRFLYRVRLKLSLDRLGGGREPK